MRAGTALLLALAACQHTAPAGSPSRHAEPRLTPEASVARFLAARSRVDDARLRNCNSQCCLPPHPVKPGGGGLDLEIDHTGDAARSVLATSNDPALLALALRDLADRVRRSDIPLIERLLDDTRPGGEVPASLSRDAPFELCPPFSWRSTTVSAEALLDLERACNTSFPDVASYRAWRAAHPTVRPTNAFEEWDQFLLDVPPPAPDLSSEQQARFRDLDHTTAARLLVVFCEDRSRQRCPEPGPIGPALARVLPPDRARRWLLLEETYPEWDHDGRRETMRSVLLRHGQSIFRPQDERALARLHASGQLSPRQRIDLLLLRAYLHPGTASDLLTSELADRAIDRAELLHRATLHDPVGFGDTLARIYLDGLPSADRHDVSPDALTVIESLAHAGPAGRPLFLRLLRSTPLPLESKALTEALVKAAHAHRCPGIDPAGDTQPLPGQGMSSRGDYAQIGGPRSLPAKRMSSQDAPYDAVQVLRQCAR